MSKRRRIVKRTLGSDGNLKDRMFQHAVDELRAAFEAVVVYGFVVAGDGDLHCMAVSPPDTARSANVTSSSSPAAIDLLCAGTAGVARDLTGFEVPGCVQVFVPWWDESGPVGAAVIVSESVPDARALRLAEAHGGSIGRGIAAARTHEAAQRRLGVLERLNGLLEAAFDATSDAVMQVDLDGIVLRWNAGCERLYGHAAVEVIGRPLPPADGSTRNAFLRELRQVAFAGQVLDREMLQSRRDGTRFRVRMMVLPLPDAAGNPASVVAIARNVTTVSDLAPDVVSPASLGSLMVRELTSPLTAVIGYAQLLSRPSIIEDFEQRQRVTRGLRDRSEELASLLEDMLLVAGLGASSLDVEPTDMAALMRGVMRRIASEDADTRFDPDRVAGAGNALVDRRRTERSIASLMRAIAEACEDDASLRVTVSVDGDVLSLRVDAEERCPGGVRSLAERLVGLNRAEIPGEVALGLHVARLVAEAHGGTVSARANAPGTVSLTLTFPTAPATDVKEVPQWRQMMA